jgi:hypothetical protein
MRIAFSLFALAACHGKSGQPGESGGYPCDLGITEWSEGEVVSPSEGVQITHSPWVPVMVHFATDEFLSGTIESWLDCEPISGPGVTRPRSDPGGGGIDFLSALDVIDLAPGEHTLVHRFTSEDGSLSGWAGSTFEYDPPEAFVTAHVTDSKGTPVFARIVVMHDKRAYDLASPDSATFDPKGRDTKLTSIFAVDGVARVRLEPGEYRFVAARGPLDTIDSETIELAAGETELGFTIDRAVPVVGWTGGDFHVHTAASFDAFLPDEPRAYSLAAAGLDVVVPADHDTVRDFEEVLEALLGENRTVFAIPGTEATILVPSPKDAKITESYGHLSVYPLDPDRVVVNPVLGDSTLADYLAGFRTTMATTPFEDHTSGILQLNHPRGIQQRAGIELEPIHDLFNKMGFDRSEPPGEKTNAWMADVATTDGTTTAFDYDALEIMNRGSWDAYNAVRLDWYGLLSWGRRITGTGNSDSHALAIEYAGFPMNLVPCQRPEQNGVDIECWIDSVKQGRLVVTTGPVVSLTLTHEKKTYEIGDQFTRKGPVTANVRVRAAPWVPVPEVRLVVNGLITRFAMVKPEDRPPGEPFESTYMWQIPPQQRDAFVVAEAGWSLDRDYPVGEEELLGDYATVVPGYLPIGFTNPIWIDQDGDGLWTGTGPPPPPK